MTTEFAIGLDAFAVLLCVGLLLRFGRISFSHPATAYFIFHLFVFTTRFWGVAAGSPTLFSKWGPTYLPVQEEELVRAMLLADLSLLAVTAGWLFTTTRGPSAPLPNSPWSQPLNPKLVWGVVALAFPVGLWGLLTQASIHGAPLAEGGVENRDTASSYLLILPTWPGLCLLALIYCYGFRLWLMVPMSAYLLVIGTQGYHRFRVVIPLIMLTQLWLNRRGKRWPPLALTAVLGTMALLFFPMKSIGTMLQSNSNIGDIADYTKEAITDTLRGDADDHLLLDEFASGITLVDDVDKFYWGQPYLALLTLPVPKQLWPEKPAISDYVYDFSTPQRPMATCGMVLTMLGEGYANFGYLGLFLVPLLFTFIVAKAYRAVETIPVGSVGHFAYLLLSSNLIQIYRDGMTSVVFFVLVHMMPLVVIVLVQNIKQITRAIVIPGRQA